MKKLFVATLVLIFSVSLFTNSVFAQDRFDELRDYSAGNVNILKYITESGNYGLIEIKADSSSVDVKTANTYSLPDPTNDNTLFGLEKKEVRLIHAGKTVTPHIYIGTVNENLQVGVIRTFSTGDIYGSNRLFLADAITQLSYIVDIPGNVEKITAFENGILVEQYNGGFHNVVYDKIYTIISLVNKTVITQSFQRQLTK